MNEKIRKAKDGASLGKALATGLEAVEYYTGLQVMALGSIERLVPAGHKAKAREHLAKYIRQTKELGQVMMGQCRESALEKARSESLKITSPAKQDDAWQKEAASLIPRRFQPATLFLEEVPPSEWKEIRSSPHWWSATNWASASYWWVDGKRNLSAIKKLCEWEAGKPMENFDLIKYYRFLEKYKYVEFVEPERR
jgi:hypothetical protein